MYLPHTYAYCTRELYVGAKIDYFVVTPHYSLVAETPLRIADFYGEGLVRTRGLRFLVLLREPVARTISSWEYKSECECGTCFSFPLEDYLTVRVLSTGGRVCRLPQVAPFPV